MTHGPEANPGDEFPFCFSLPTVRSYLRWLAFRRAAVWWVGRDEQEARFYQDLLLAEFRWFGRCLAEEEWGGIHRAAGRTGANQFAGGTVSHGGPNDHDHIGGAGMSTRMATGKPTYRQYAMMTRRELHEEWAAQSRLLILDRKRDPVVDADWSRKEALMLDPDLRLALFPPQSKREVNDHLMDRVWSYIHRDPSLDLMRDLHRLLQQAVRELCERWPQYAVYAGYKK